MKIDEKEENGVLILGISGAVDLVSHTTLHDALQGYMKAGKIKLILDLQDCTYVDSSGFSCLISNLHHIIDRNGRMVIARPANIERALRVTGLVETFSIFETVEDAVENLAD